MAKKSPERLEVEKRQKAMKTRIRQRKIMTRIKRKAERRFNNPPLKEE